MIAVDCIRRVRPDDRVAWLALRTELWPDGAQEHGAEIDAYFRGEARGLDAALLAFTSSGEAVGLIELTKRPFAEGCETSPVAYVEGWVVTEASRGFGVGRRLMEAAAAWAHAEGCEELASDTELENERSAAAHRALGFEEVCVTRNFRLRLDGASR